MIHALGTTQRLVKEHFWGVLFLVVLLIGANIAVRTWKAQHPGAMNILESQAMDMSVMKPPVGAVPVATEVVHLGPFSQTVTYTGSVAPFQEQIIYARVEGILQGLNVYNGDRVSQGQLLATVDSPDLQSRVAEASAGAAAAASEIPTARYNVARMTAESSAARNEILAAKNEATRARAAVAAAERSVTQRQKDVNAAQANSEFWQAEAIRQEKLYKGGMISLSDYQSAKAKAVTADADLGNKQAAVEEARANVEAAKADVANKDSLIAVANQRASAAAAAVASSSEEVRQKSAAAQQARAMAATAATISNYRNIRTPFAGILTKRYVSPGQFVTPSTAIASVVQIDTVRLQANVADTHLSSVHRGMPVTARFTKDSGLVVHATVTSVSPLADQSSRTATVEAIIPNPSHRLVPGDAVTLEIAVSDTGDTISVPASAVVQKDGLPAIWVTQVVGTRGKTLYTCTMHPEVINDEPGVCPKCLMKLVPTKSGGDKKARLVPIRIGPTTGDRVQVLSGLADGAEVITQGNTYLQEGDTVYPTTWTADGPSRMPPAAGMESMPGMDHGVSNTLSHDMADMPDMDKQPMTTGKQVTPTQGQKMYVCPMHPHEMSHNPDALCRLCGMKLVEKK